MSEVMWKRRLAKCKRDGKDIEDRPHERVEVIRYTFVYFLTIIEPREDNQKSTNVH
jgi:hypothetical protein